MKDKLLISKGDIIYVDLGNNFETDQKFMSELGKCRPCAVLQNDVGNAFSSTLIIVPISRKPFKGQATQVVLTPDLLEYSSQKLIGLLLTEQIRVIGKQRVVGEKIGKLNEEGLKKVEKAIMVAVGIKRAV